MCKIGGPTGAYLYCLIDKCTDKDIGHSSIATTGNIYGHLQFKQKISTGIVLENLLA